MAIFYNTQINTDPSVMPNKQGALFRLEQQPFKISVHIPVERVYIVGSDLN